LPHRHRAFVRAGPAGTIVRLAEARSAGERGVFVGRALRCNVHLTGSEVTTFAAVLATVVALLSLRQKANNDRRDAWWKRAQWAIDKSLSERPEDREVGLAAMLVLVAKEAKAAPADLRVLKPAVQRALDNG